MKKYKHIYIYIFIYIYIYIYIYISTYLVVSFSYNIQKTFLWNEHSLLNMIIIFTISQVFVMKSMYFMYTRPSSFPSSLTHGKIRTMITITTTSSSSSCSSSTVTDAFRSNVCQTILAERTFHLSFIILQLSLKFCNHDVFRRDVIVQFMYLSKKERNDIQLA
jgi:hypothetical protein